MRKTTQTVEYTVEGPNEAGRYRVSPPDEGVNGWYFQGDFNDTARAAIQKHIESAPKVVEFEGYLIGPHTVSSGYAVWNLTDRSLAEEGSYGIISMENADEAYHYIEEYASEPHKRGHIAPLLALAHFFEKGMHND